MQVYRGKCHCGRVEIAFGTKAAHSSLDVRACGCSFCSRHGARTVSDPDGTLSIRAAGGDVLAYRFGLGISDFLLCRSCGCYVAVTMDDPDGVIGAANVLMLDQRSLFTTPAAPRDYGAEDEAGRRARRRTIWTPVAALPAFDAA